METGDLVETVKRRALASPPPRVRSQRAVWARALRAWVRADFQGQRYLVWGGALLALVAVTTTLYYAATPAVIIDPDTATYLHFARNIHHGLIVSGVRMPGYPVFIDLVFLVTGEGNLVAVANAQAAVFAVSTLALYALGALIFRRAWMAFVPAALVGANIYIISYIKPILSEGLAQLCVIALMLAFAYFALRPAPRRLWLVAAALSLAFLTRPEWIYLPIPLLLFMLLLSWRAGVFREVARHALGSTVAIYTIAGAYAAVNKLGHGFFGLTDVQGINLLGKVMQYDLTGAPPPSYAALDRIVASAIASGDKDPWTLVSQVPQLGADHYQLASHYATAMILRHPLAFASGCWSTLLSSLSTAGPYHPLPAFAGALTPLIAMSHFTLSSLLIALPVTVVWLALLLWPGGPRTRVVGIMSGLSLMALYALVTTTAGGYTQYDRVHVPFDPLLVLIVAGSLIYWGVSLARGLRARRSRGSVESLRV